MRKCSQTSRTSPIHTTITRPPRFLSKSRRQGKPLKLELESSHPRNGERLFSAASVTFVWCVFRLPASRCVSSLTQGQNVVQPTLSLQRPLQGRLVPDKMDREAWWAFLDGAPEAAWNPPNARKQNKQHRQRGRARFTNNLDPSVLEAGWELVPPVQAALSAPATSLVAAAASQSMPFSEGQAADPEDASSLATEASGPILPREPTPALLHHLDHVRRALQSRVPSDLICSDFLCTCSCTSRTGSQCTASLSNGATLCQSHVPSSNHMHGGSLRCS
jgi:hypothetical protein